MNQTARLAEFLGVQPTPALLEQAIGRSAADNMRKLEKTQGDNWVSTKGKRTDIPFVRGAVSGGWKTKLPESSIAEIEAAWGSLMTALGYELVTRPEEAEVSISTSDRSKPSSIFRSLAPERR
jgi:hypothetical protein